MEGLDQLQKTPKREIFLRKGFWVVLLLTGMSVLAWHSSTLILRYLKKPISTEIIHDNNMNVFPVIKICNSAAMTLTYSEKIMFSKFPNETATTLNNNFAVTNFTGKTIDYNTINITRHDHELTANIFRALVKENPHFLKVAASQLNEFILHCSYNGIDCDKHKDITAVADDTYLRCFNIQPTARDLHVSHLDLVIFANKLGNVLHYNPVDLKKIGGMSLSAYRFSGPPVIDYSNGAILSIYPQGTYPHDIHQIHVAAGQHTVVKVAQTNFSLFNIRGKRCKEATHSNTHVTYKSLEGTQDFVYNSTLYDCLWRAFLIQFYKRCGCMPTVSLPADLYTENIYCFDISKSNFTLRTANNRLQCQRTLFREKSTIMSKSSCISPCKYTHYSTNVIGRAWPAREAVTSTVREYLSPVKVQYDKVKTPPFAGVENMLRWTNEVEEAFKIEYLLKRNTSNKIAANSSEYATYKIMENDLFSVVSDNFLKLRIQMDESRAVLVRETESYPLQQLLSDIAGITGVYLGVSLMTLYECYDMFKSLMSIIKAMVRDRPKEEQVSACNSKEGKSIFNV